MYTGWLVCIRGERLPQFSTRSNFSIFCFVFPFFPFRVPKTKMGNNCIFCSLYAPKYVKRDFTYDDLVHRPNRSSESAHTLHGKYFMGLEPIPPIILAKKWPFLWKNGPQNDGIFFWLLGHFYFRTTGDPVLNISPS